MVRERYESLNFTDDRGRLRDRRVPGGEILLPGKLWLSESRLNWEIEIGRARERKISGGLLERFVKLWKATAFPESVLKFASEWGPLGFDTAGNRVNANAAVEDLSYWHFLSRRAYAVLAIAKELNEDLLGKDDDWQLLSTPENTPAAPAEFFGFPDWSLRQVDMQNFRDTGNWWGKVLDLFERRDLLASEVSLWLRRFAPQLAIGVDKKSHWRLEVRYQRRALPAIAMQLALTVSGGDLYVCSECKELYIRAGTRKPNRGHENFCRDCRGENNIAAVKRADERRRKKMAEAKRLYVEGFTIAQIADQLGTKKATASRWVRGRNVHVKKARIG